MRYQIYPNIEITLILVKLVTCTLYARMTCYIIGENLSFDVLCMLQFLHASY